MGEEKPWVAAPRESPLVWVAASSPDAQFFTCRIRMCEEHRGVEETSALESDRCAFQPPLCHLGIGIGVDCLAPVCLCRPRGRRTLLSKACLVSKSPTSPRPHVPRPQSQLMGHFFQRPVLTPLPPANHQIFGVLGVSPRAPSPSSPSGGSSPSPPSPTHPGTPTGH